MQLRTQPSAHLLPFTFDCEFVESIVLMVRESTSRTRSAQILLSHKVEKSSYSTRVVLRPWKCIEDYHEA